MWFSCMKQILSWTSFFLFLGGGLVISFLRFWIYIDWEELFSHIYHCESAGRVDVESKLTEPIFSIYFKHN